MASDDDFFVLRRFGKLGARVVLHMQYQISKLEEDLEREDDLCRHAPNDEDADNGSFRGDPRPQRHELLVSLASILGQYRTA